MGIGGKLSDGRSTMVVLPDYDDWSTIAENGRRLVSMATSWFGIQCWAARSELSSMGIRVDKESLCVSWSWRQGRRENTVFHKRLLADRTAAGHQWWYWPESSLHDISSQGPYRRTPKLASGLMTCAKSANVWECHWFKIRSYISKEVIGHTTTTFKLIRFWTWDSSKTVLFL